MAPSALLIHDSKTRFSRYNYYLLFTDKEAETAWLGHWPVGTEPGVIPAKVGPDHGSLDFPLLEPCVAPTPSCVSHWGATVSPAGQHQGAWGPGAIKGRPSVL